SLELFRADRTDILTITPLPINNAVSSFNTNQGGAQRREGLDFSVTSQNFEGVFGWETTLNISTFKNRWVERNPFMTLESYQNDDDRNDDGYGWPTNRILNK